MLTRRHIRAKVMQSIYACRQGGVQDMVTVRKNLIHGIEKIEELYAAQLTILLAVRDMAESRIEAHRSKRLATYEDLNPNVRFITNPLFATLEECPALKKLTERYPSRWKDRSEYVEICLNALVSSAEYAEYMNGTDESFAAHKRMAVYLFKKIIAPCEALADYYEDCQMDWVADLQVANSMLLKTITDIEAEDTAESIVIPSLFKDALDRDFAVRLLEKTMETSSQWRPMIEEKLQNWDADRIAMVDFILMEMAATEFACFPSIPAKVTLNEYIEISKDYSSSKSKLFVNGVLDRLLVQMQENGMVNKSGRGLM